MRRQLISSDHHPEIRRLVALRDKRSERHSERCFIVEGPRFVLDAVRRQDPLLLVVSKDLEESLTLPTGIDRLVVTESLFRKISDTESPQGLIGIFAFPSRHAPHQRAELKVIADGIQDPGNLGTIIRSATAFGATSVVAGAKTVDPFAPKVVRATAGTLFEITIDISDEPEHGLAALQVVLADGQGITGPDQIDWTLPTALVVGSEAHGVSETFRSLPHVLVAIPMSGEVESLNAGVAASILLYEANRQRRKRTG